MICKDGAEWKRRVTAQGCQVHTHPGDCEMPLQAHHVITQQQLRRHGLEAHVIDTDIGMGTCYRAHRMHHNRTLPIPYELIPDAAIRFAFEHGLDWLLDRYYPKATMEVPE